jgi:co-chaperonin GroES (HSP10)
LLQTQYLGGKTTNMVPVNKVIVSLQEFMIETESGLILNPELEYKPEQSASISGIVVSEEFILNHAGAKRFYLNKKDQRVMYKFSDFSKFLQKGDRVWFMYQADLREHWMFESNDHWIPFDDIWFYERDGVLYAADGLVLVRPIDIMEKFMEYETVVGTHQDRGEVIAIGNRLKGQEDLGLNLGDVILFDPKMVDKSMAYKGKKVWAVDFDSVLCVL